MVRAVHMENGRVRKEAGSTARGCPRADSNCHSGGPQGGRHITPPCGLGSKSKLGALVCKRVFTHSVRKVKKKSKKPRWTVGLCSSCQLEIWDP